MSKESRKKAIDLVSRSTGGNSRLSWYSLLSPEYREYVQEIVSEMCNAPGAKLNFVADEIKKELNITSTASTIARTLREMIRNAEEKKESK